MPNQRSKHKRHIGGFVHESLHAKITRWAKKDGMSHDRFGFCAKLIAEGIERREKRSVRAEKRVHEIAPPKGYRLLRRNEVPKTPYKFLSSSSREWVTGISGSSTNVGFRLGLGLAIAYARPLPTKKGSK